MRKIISVLLAVIMIFSVMSIAVSAEDAIRCRCGNHDGTKGKTCYCCVNCPELPENHRFSCATVEGDQYKVCCTKCDGYYGAVYDACKCNCGCTTCANSGQGDGDDSFLDNFVSEEDKESFVDGFQAILRRISEAFDNFFNAIFEFLRLDEILGRN